MLDRMSQIGGWVFAGLVILGCGGRATKQGEPAEGASEGGGADGATSSGGRPTGGATSNSGAASSAPRGCPDGSWGDCHAGLRLTLDTRGRTDVVDGVWAEPLQVETPPPLSTSPSPPGANRDDTESWDRSELPAGACVFRVHGAAAACFATGAHLTFGACNPGGEQGPVPLSYYELPHCAEGVAPGCPPEWWGGESYVWYASRDEEDAVTVVLCPRLCETALLTRGACISHAPGITAP